MNFIGIGILIGVSIILLWYIWAEFSYKYSNDRLEDLVLKRYELTFKKSPNEVYHASIRRDGNTIIATMTRKDLPGWSEIISYKMLPASQCNVFNRGCIAV